MESVTPGTGSSWLSSTSPTMAVSASGPATTPVTAKTTGSSANPSNPASTRLTPIPGCGPRVNVAAAMPWPLVTSVTVSAPAKEPSPEITR